MRGNHRPLQKAEVKTKEFSDVVRFLMPVRGISCSHEEGETEVQVTSGFRFRWAISWAAEQTEEKGKSEQGRGTSLLCTGSQHEGPREG